MDHHEQHCILALVSLYLCFVDIQSAVAAPAVGVCVTVDFGPTLHSHINLIRVHTVHKPCERAVNVYIMSVHKCAYVHVCTYT